MRLDGKVAVVTGGGSGIGRAICRRFHAARASILVNYISLEKARETAALLGLGKAQALVADVSDSPRVREMFDYCPGLTCYENDR